MTIMLPSLSITCKTVWLHANSPVSKPEVDPEVKNRISSGPNWSTVADRERELASVRQRTHDGCLQQEPLGRSPPSNITPSVVFVVGL